MGSLSKSAAWFLLALLASPLAVEVDDEAGEGNRGVEG